MASNACEEAPRFLLWTADGLYELPEVRFKFSFNLIGQINGGFSTVQSLRELESQFSGGGPEQGFRRCFEDGLSQRFFLWRSRLQRSCQRKSSDESRLPHYVRNLIRKYKTL